MAKKLVFFLFGALIMWIWNVGDRAASVDPNGVNSTRIVLHLIAIATTIAFIGVNAHIHWNDTSETKIRI